MSEDTAADDIAVRVAADMARPRHVPGPPLDPREVEWRRARADESLREIQREIAAEQLAKDQRARAVAERESRQREAAGNTELNLRSAHRRAEIAANRLLEQRWANFATEVNRAQQQQARRKRTQEILDSLTNYDGSPITDL